jgi:hypothetical protein
VPSAYGSRSAAEELPPRVLLTRHGSSVGITTSFLTPEGDAEERIYRRAGYTCTTEILHIWR